MLLSALSSCFIQSKRSGGARRDRTDDLLNANQALSQLSYGPGILISGHIGMCGVARLPLQICWWVREDLNLRPHPYQGCALTN